MDQKAEAAIAAAKQQALLGVGALELGLGKRMKPAGLAIPRWQGGWEKMGTEQLSPANLVKWMGSVNENFRVVSEILEDMKKRIESLENPQKIEYNGKLLSEMSNAERDKQFQIDR